MTLYRKNRNECGWLAGFMNVAILSPALTFPPPFANHGSSSEALQCPNGIPRSSFFRAKPVMESQLDQCWARSEIEHYEQLIKL